MPQLASKATITAFTGTGLVTVIDDSTGTPDVRLMSPGNVTAPVSTTHSGTTYSLVAADDCTSIVFSNAALVTVTIPTNATTALRVGFRALLVSSGAGGLTLSTTGITLVGSSPNKTIAQNEGIYVEKKATDTWMILGGTST